MLNVCLQCKNEFWRKPTKCRPTPKFCSHRCNKLHQNFVRWHGNDVNKQKEAEEFFKSLTSHSTTGDGECDGLKICEDWAISSQATGETWRKVQRLPEEKQAYKLSNKTLWSALVGMVLGDANIQQRVTGARIQIAHKRKASEYVGFKASILSQFPDVIVSDSPTLHQHRKLRKTYEQTRLWTSNHAIFAKSRELFYRPEKIVTEELLNALDPLGLAIWYMDDGSIVKNAASISTYCFSKAQHELIVAWFSKKFGITAKIGFDRKRDKNFIKFSVPETGKLLLIVAPYVSKIQCMQYKLKYASRSKVLNLQVLASMNKGHEYTAPVIQLAG